MNHQRLIQIIQAYGTRPENWPAEERADAQALLAANETDPVGSDDYQVRRLLAGEAHIDDALDSYAVTTPLYLRSRILADLPKKLLLDRVLEWLLPDLGELRSYFWRPALVACLPLVIGLMLGNNLFTVDSSEAWEDEIALIALDDSQLVLIDE
jgi:hypothetical protein